jgi:uridine phosphorylase
VLSPDIVVCTILICTRAMCSGLHVADATHGKPAKSHWSVLRRLPQQDAAVLAVEIYSGVVGVHDRFFAHAVTAAAEPVQDSVVT